MAISQSTFWMWITILSVIGFVVHLLWGIRIQRRLQRLRDHQLVADQLQCKPQVGRTEFLTDFQLLYLERVANEISRRYHGPMSEMPIHVIKKREAEALLYSSYRHNYAYQNMLGAGNAAPHQAEGVILQDFKAVKTRDWK